MRFILYGVTRDGLVYSLRDDRFGVTGQLRWHSILSGQAKALLRARMAQTLQEMHRQATAPSKNTLKRSRQRGL